jgi:hypothetical protein
MVRIKQYIIVDAVINGKMRYGYSYVRYRKWFVVHSTGVIGLTAVKKRKRRLK